MVATSTQINFGAGAYTNGALSIVKALEPNATHHRAACISLTGQLLYTAAPCAGTLHPCIVQTGASQTARAHTHDDR